MGKGGPSQNSGITGEWTEVGGREVHGKITGARKSAESSSWYGMGNLLQLISRMELCVVCSVCENGENTQMTQSALGPIHMVPTNNKNTRFTYTERIPVEYTT